MKSVIKEPRRGNNIPQEDSRNDSPEMKELMEYLARYHDDLLKTMTDEQNRSKTYSFCCKIVFITFQQQITNKMQKTVS